METLSSLSIEELLRRCSAVGNPDAWEEFIRRFHRLIATVVLRTVNRLGDSSTSTVDDLIQETYLKLCEDHFRLLRSFEQQHQGAFFGYIKVVTANVVRDHFKSVLSEKRGAGRVDQIADDFTPSASEGRIGSPKAIERAVIIKEVREHLEYCITGPDQERNRKIFWLYYRAGLSARAIATLPGIKLTTKGVESIIMRITRDLRQRMASPREKKEPGIQETGEGILPAQSF